MMVHRDEARTNASPQEITSLLRAWRAGDAGAGERLIETLYGELREMARRRLAGEPPSHTLQTTALVHEAFIRLAGQRRVTWHDRGHFLALAATVMRRVLVDRARARRAAKRGSGVTAGVLTDAVAAGVDPATEILDVDRALERLGASFPRQTRVVELRFFGGLEIEEIAAVLEVTERTVNRDWAFARSWLARELGGRGAP